MVVVVVIVVVVVVVVVIIVILIIVVVVLAAAVVVEVVIVVVAVVVALSGPCGHAIKAYSSVLLHDTALVRLPLDGVIFGYPIQQLPTQHREEFRQLLICSDNSGLES